MLPYADVTTAADRRWTTRLLARLGTNDLPDDELAALVAALQAVSDPGSFRALETVVTDTTRPERIRNAASAALRGMHFVALDVPVATLRRWWCAGDAVLRRHALLSMDGIRCSDIVVRTASDPTHPFQVEALSRMEWWFDRPEHEAVKVAGLTHPNPKVRATAASVLLWDEPVVAELPLIEATRDPVPAVVAEAANTLEYYPSLRVLRRLSEMLDHADDNIREQVTDSYDSIRSQILACLCERIGGVAAHFKKWLRPVWDLLAFSDEELTSNDEVVPPHRKPQREAMVVSELLDLLTEPGTSPRLLEQRLQNTNWESYDEEQRRMLRTVFLGHRDQLVRDQSTSALAAWGDVTSLLDLLHDPDYSVRKAAMYQLGQLPRTLGIADRAWDHLHRHDTIGTHSTETLTTFVKHANPVDAIWRLGWIAGDHGRREDLRTAAVGHLAQLGAREQLQQLASNLQEPPAVTWGLHLALLDAIADFRLSMPNIEHLRDMDHLFVQRAIARCTNSAVIQE